MMFETSQPTEFRNFLSVINVLAEAPIIRLTPDGFSILEMDPSHVAMVELNLPYGFFDTWRVTQEDKFTIDLPTVLKALNKINKRDTCLQFDYDYDTAIEDLAQVKENERTVFTLKSNINRVKTVPCLETVETEMPKPKIWFKSKTRMILPTLRLILEDYKDNLQLVRFTSTDDTLRIHGESDAYDESVTLDKGDDDILEHRVDEPSNTVYDLDKLIKFLTKAVKISEVCTVNFSDNMPLRLDIEIPIGTLKFWLAPCIGV
jgi:proliferating cell nuclear antigen